MRILVTGADGQLGRAFRELAVGDVVGVSGAEWIFASRAELDIVSAGAVDAFVDRWRPGVVVNCAAFTDVDGAERDPAAAFAVNCDGAGNLARACVGVGAALVHVSTDYVFGGSQESRVMTNLRPYTETDPPAPVNVYGESKLAGERAVFESGCRGAVVRTSWLWSAGGGFVAAIEGAARRAVSEHRLPREVAGTPRGGCVGAEIRVVADQVGTPTEAGSLAAALMRVVSTFDPASPHPPGVEAANLRASSGSGNPSGAELFHFTDGPVMSRAEWAGRIVAAAGLDCRVVPVSSEEFVRDRGQNAPPASTSASTAASTAPPLARRPGFSALDPTKFMRTFGLL